jgi:hypothetical protein
MVLHASLASVVLAVTLAAGAGSTQTGQRSEPDTSMRNKITIRIGDKTFAATLADNATAAAFAKLLPLSLTMNELNGNEKFARLSVNVPTQASIPPTIQAGDLMMYGSNTLVLFYKSFRTTYSYTNIGRVDDPAGREAALGSGNVDVAFELAGQPKQ